MQIELLRHGKVNMKWNSFYAPQSYDLDCQKYDSAPVFPVEQKPVSASPIIYISDLIRTRQTAEALFPNHSLIQTSLLNEVPLASFTDTRFALPLWFWFAL